MGGVDYASISYVDEHVGYILQTLESSGLADNTLVLFHADVRPPTLPCLSVSIATLGSHVPAAGFSTGITWENTASGRRRATSTWCVLYFRCLAVGFAFVASFSDPDVCVVAECAVAGWWCYH